MFIIKFSFINNVTRIITFPTQIPDCQILTVMLFWICFCPICFWPYYLFFSGLPFIENFCYFFVTVSIEFLITQTEIVLFTAPLLSILLVIRMKWWVLLLLFSSFVSDFKSELVIKFLTINISSSPIHFYGFWLLALLP